MYDVSKCNTPCTDNNNKYYGIQHGLKKDFEPRVDISATYLTLTFKDSINMLFIYLLPHDHMLCMLIYVNIVYANYVNDFMWLLSHDVNVD